MSRKLVAWSMLVGLLSLLAWIGNATQPAPKDLAYKFSTAAGEVILFGVVLAIIVLISRGLPAREAFALRPPYSWRRAAGIGGGVLILIFLTNALLDPLLHPAREQGLAPTRWEPAHAAAFAANAFALAIVGPVVEELTFRGLGFSLLRRYGDRFAIVVVGITFAVWHGLPAALPVLFVFGVALAYVRSRTGSIYPCIVLHAFFNAAALAIAVTI